jgi:hypothetical protein
MTTLFYTSAFLAFAVGVVHSILGERYILVRLFMRSDLPRLFGGTAFTIRTLRYAWPITTVAMWGFAAIFVLLAQKSVSSHSLSFVLAVTALLTSLICCCEDRVTTSSRSMPATPNILSYSVE